MDGEKEESVLGKGEIMEIRKIQRMKDKATETAEKLGVKRAKPSSMLGSIEKGLTLSSTLQRGSHITNTHIENTFVNSWAFCHSGSDAQYWPSMSLNVHSSNYHC